MRRQRHADGGHPGEAWPPLDGAIARRATAEGQRAAKSPGGLPKKGGGLPRWAHRKAAGRLDGSAWGSAGTQKAPGPSRNSVQKLVGERHVDLQVFLVDLDVQLSVVLHHHAEHVVDDLHLRDELGDLRVVEELQGLRAALLLGLRPLQHDAPEGVALEDGIPDADDVLPALVGVAGVEAGDLLLKSDLLPALRGHLVEALLREPLVVVAEPVLAVGGVEAGQRGVRGPSGARAPRGRARRLAGLHLEDRAGVDDWHRHDEWQELGQEVPAGGLDPGVHRVGHDDDLAHLHRELERRLHVLLELTQGPLVLLVVRRGPEEAQGRPVVPDPVGGAERVVPVKEDDRLLGLEVLRLAAGAHHGLDRLPNARLQPPRGLHAILPRLVRAG
mmetsp:Transcript_16485/g.33404  ORF Transcript_16485/g.33404 Transcript_16485/m.33404 type:complete len:387 (-) Transcript_16485:71-1231(-)